MNIDAHFHVWQIGRGDYGWLTPALAPIYRDVSVEHWWAQAQGLGIARGLLVQAAPTRAETDFLLQQARQHPERVAGVIGWVDLQSADACEQVGARAREPRLKGLRPMLQDIVDTRWIAQAHIQPALACMAHADLVFDALIEPRHLSVICEVAHAHPQLRIVLDHGAKPDMSAQHAALADWRAAMQTLAGLSRPAPIMCKLSGLWTEAPRGQPCDSVQPWAQALLEIWGPKRLIWGSDWPVLELAGGYDEWHRYSRSLCASLSPNEQDALFGGNAQRMYRLD